LPPSLDLKRRQLATEREVCQRELEQAGLRAETLEGAVARACQMLADEAERLTGLVRVVAVHESEENVIGTRLPRLDRLHFEVEDYGPLSRPFWVDSLVIWLQEALRIQVEIQFNQRRFALQQQAERKVSQRFNLFDKVPIPRTRARIKTILIHLADAERADVANSKITKRRKQRQLQWMP